MTMSFSPAASGLLRPLFSNETIDAIFSDEQFVGYMLQVEAALARVQSRMGLTPAGAGAAITAGVNELDVDYERLRAGIEKDGLPIVELVNQLRAQVGDAAASYVHWGATTQDIMDTALVLQMRAAIEHFEPNLQHVVADLGALADHHRHTLMSGRTHSQQALPIPFGLKVAAWLAPLLRHQKRLQELKPRLFVLQFGGAAGTLAALGATGIQIQEELAAELNLRLPPIPWHTQRDNLVEVASWLSLVSGSLAKMAQDVILLAQSEIGEVRESDDFSRGGSSTMPQKRNPIVSELIVAAARTNAALLSAMHQAMVQEHERGTHGWQVEWLNLPPMFTLTAAALEKARYLSAHLVVDEERMQQNVKASNGLMLAEAITFALSPPMPRTEAKQLVKACCQAAIEQNRHLVDVVRERTNAAVDWQQLRDETNYFGVAQQFIDRVLREAQAG